MVIVVALLSAPCTYPMEQTLEAASSDQGAKRDQASRNLLQAAKEGNLQRVQTALNDGAGINTKTI